MTEQAEKTPVNAGELVSKLTLAVQRELETVVMALKERGLQRFVRISALGLAAVAVSYRGFYAPASKKLESLDRRIATAKAAARYSDRYKDTKLRLDRLRALFPPPGQADNWALERVRQTLNARNIVPDSISPPESHPANGFLEQAVRFSMSAKFPDLVGWLNDLELGKGMIQVTSLDVAKQGSEIGVNRINCTVETLLSASGATP